MRFYTTKRRYYCGVDLYTRSMYACILDWDGEDPLVHRKIRCDPDPFLRLIAPYRDDLIVDIECMFCRYWVADLCADEGITFVLGHALYSSCTSGSFLIRKRGLRPMSGSSTTGWSTSTKESGWLPLRSVPR